jgi:predicted aminopeptidase
MKRPKKHRVRKWLAVVVLLAIVGAVAGCQTLGYYGQAIKGQYQIFAHRQPVEKLIADTNTPARLREQLELLQKLRAFAAGELKLPVDDHYRKYTDVHRPYVVWNVQAAPQFSLEPKSWWYPVVGSLEYRGYFSESGATNCAGRLARKGYDVYVDGVEAYSTLGWFKDPVLNTFIHHGEAELAETIFHELGHQRVFAHGDTDFNEAFATTVGQEGTRRWLRAQGDTNACEAYRVSLVRHDQFVHLILSTRAKLEKTYGDTRDKSGKIRAAHESPASPDRLREEKQRVFADLRRDYAELKAQWNGANGYDDWFDHDLNNAQLNTIANYYDFVPDFVRLLQSKDGDLEKFYDAVERLAKLSKEVRHQRLRELAKGNSEEESHGTP